MLTYKDLVRTESALQGQTVLSVYVNGEERDPSKRQQWRLELRHALDDIDRWLVGSSHAERESFKSCRAVVEERLGAGVRAPGWFGFFTAAGEHSSGPLPVATPTMAAWSTGPTLAPCIRVLKESRAVIVAVVDSTGALIYEYIGHTAELLDTVQTRPSIDADRHMGRPPRSGFHMGTRGPTGRDRAQRELRDATSHMLDDLADRVTDLAGRDGWLLVGGIPTVALSVLKHLRPELAHRAAHAESIGHDATVAEVGEAARECASKLRNADDERRVDAILASSESDGRGVSGVVGVLQSLQASSVRELYFTASFMTNHMADAEAAVRRALSTHALIEQVSGLAAERLDQVGGIAARLRYAVSTPEAVAVAQDSVAR